MADSENTQYTIVDTARLMPVRGAEDGPLLPGKATGGVQTAAGEALQAGNLIRQYAPIQPDAEGVPRARVKPAFAMLAPAAEEAYEGEGQKLQGEAIFAGYLFRHFGHFLLESLSRLWFMKQHPDLPVVWLAVHGQAEFAPWQKDMLDRLGVNASRHIVADRPLVVERLLLASDGYRVQTHFTAQQRDALAYYPARTPKAGKKVWLSRAGQTKGRILNDTALEDYLARRGWIIFCPEAHDLDSQLAMLADAERIAGVAGSAFHSLMLIAGLKARVDVFSRGPTLSYNFPLIAKLGGWEQHEHFTPLIVWPTPTPGWQRDYLWPTLDEALSRLDIPRPLMQLPELPSALDEIMRAEGLRSYVDFGAQIKAFHSLASGVEKDFVAADFVQDVRVHQCEGRQYFEMLPDQFFLTGRATGRTYDMVAVTENVGRERLIALLHQIRRCGGPKSHWLLPLQERMGDLVKPFWNQARMRRVQIDGRAFAYIQPL